MLKKLSERGSKQVWSIRTMFALMFIVLFVFLPSSIQFLPEWENIGVVWAEGGTVLKVLFRENNEFFVREWDFSGERPEEIEVFPYDPENAFFSKEAYATGKIASVRESGAIVTITKFLPNGEEYVSRIELVWGHITG